MTRLGRLATGATLLAACGCEAPETFVPIASIGGPAGVLEGTVTYAGPKPCTEGGRVLGVAAVVGFDTRLLPPPEGFGATAQSLDVIDGERFFAGVRGELVFDPYGRRLCPAADQTILASAPFSLGPLPAATYEVRGFYDRKGDFDPAFSISNLPSKGDLGGGAIDNASEALAGARPVYRRIDVGRRDADGRLSMPDEGVRVGGIAVALGLPLPLHRPVFHVVEALGPAALTADGVTLAADYPVAKFSLADPAGTEKALARLVLGAGVPDGEVAAAAAPPLGLPVGSTASTILLTRLDVNGDGAIDDADHVPETSLLPELAPVFAWSRLAGSSGLTIAERPVVALTGLVLRGSLTATAATPPDLAEPRAALTVALRPSALCFDPLGSEPAVLVVARRTDGAGNALVPDEPALAASLERRLGRPVQIAYGCLPRGRYAASLVYPSTQAWTVPNEAGVCAPSEAPSAAGCGSRARLPSQGVVFEVGAPGDPSYCAANPTPAACAE